MVLGVGPTDRDTGLRAGRGAWVVQAEWGASPSDGARRIFRGLTPRSGPARPLSRGGLCVVQGQIERVLVDPRACAISGARVGPAGLHGSEAGQVGPTASRLRSAAGRMIPHRLLRPARL
jgi:hypothetical protein